MTPMTAEAAPRGAVSWPKQTLTFARLTVLGQLKNRRTLLFALGFPVVFYLLESRVFIPQSGPGAATDRADRVSLSER